MTKNHVRNGSLPPKYVAAASAKAQLVNAAAVLHARLSYWEAEPYIARINALVKRLEKMGGAL